MRIQIIASQSYFAWERAVPETVLGWITVNLKSEDLGAVSAAWVGVVVAWVGVVVTAVLSLRTHRRTKKAAALRAIEPFYSAYISAEFCEKMRQLRDFRETNGTKFAKKWQQLYESHDGNAVRLEQALRELKYHFYLAAFMRREGLVDKRLHDAFYGTKSTRAFVRECIMPYEAKFTATCKDKPLLDELERGY